MYFDHLNGKEIVFNDADNAIEYLRKIPKSTITTTPDNLRIRSDGKNLSLIIEGKIFPVRTSFLKKLLRWFNFPLGQIKYLDIETVASIMNDFLLNIKSNTVDVTIENNEVLTITSDKFGKVENLILIQKVKPLGISKIFMNDYMTAIITESKEEITPFPGDTFGFGVSLINSETGFRAFSIKSYLLRYVCSNGAYVSENQNEKKFFHYELNVEEIYEHVNSRISSINYKKELITEKILMLKEQKEFEKTKQKIAEILLPKIGRFQTNKIFEDTREIKNNYDLFNHITLKAKEFEISTRILLEEVAGELLFFN